MISTANTIDLQCIAGFMRGIAPDPLITVSEWADAYRMLPAESAKPGKFEMRVTPYNREIADRLSVTDKAQLIIFKKSSQVGATETGNNWLGYVVDNAPSSFLYVMPTDGMIKDVSKTRIQKMFDTTPRLKEKMAAYKSRDNGNTILKKQFEGGSLTMVGANSPVGLASTPIRFVYMDEIDRYPLNVDGEGSALSLAKTRTLTYGATKKMFLTSTPTLEGTSAIDNEFAKTGQRYYYVPCPICNHKQTLVFEQLRYEIVNNKTEEATYECINCGHHIEERFKTYMLENGEWIATYPALENGLVYGYHINALYSPYGMYSWVEMVCDYLDALNDTPKMISFVNTKLGETFKEEQGEKPDWETLYNRAHNENLKYEKNKPFTGVVFITAGVDVQADRLEVQLIGWMEGKRSQVIDYRVLVGNTDNSEVWKELAKIVTETWVRADNHAIPLRCMAIDTGYNTTKVYDFVKNYTTTQVIAVKGSPKVESYYNAPKPIEYNRSGKKIGKVKVFGVGVNIIKSELYGWLKQSIDADTGEIPTGYCHLLAFEGTTYYRGLTAEELQKHVNKKNYTEYIWVKKYERNEPLDTWVYARAAASYVGIDRWNEARWKEELLNSGVPVELKDKPKLPPPPPKRGPFWS